MPVSYTHLDVYKRQLKARWLWWVAGLSLLGMIWDVPFPLIVAAAALTGWHMQKQHALPAIASAPGAPKAALASDGPAWLNDHSPAHTLYSLSLIHI